MSLPKIPTGLCVAANPYSYGGPTGGRRSEVAGGRGRYALNYYGGTSQFAVTFILTPDQQRVWTMFYTRRIALGTLPFEMELDSGLGILPHECNILPDSYQVSKNQTVWAVSFNVEARSTAYDLDPCIVDLEIDYWDCTGEPLCPMLERLDIFANSDVLILNSVRDPGLVSHLDGSRVLDAFGIGSPEGAEAAGVGSTYRRTNGRANTSFYVKESGSAGWVAK